MTGDIGAIIGDCPHDEQPPRPKSWASAVEATVKPTAAAARVHTKGLNMGAFLPQWGGVEER